MNKIYKLALILMIAAAAVTSVPRTAAADTFFCDRCAATGQCRPCCVCDGGTIPQCVELCGG
jgi:hypothetical protein